MICGFVSCLSPRDLLHRSGSPEKRDAAPHGYIPREADGYLVSIDYDRHLRPSTGIGKHLVKFIRVFLHIDIDSLIAIGCTSLAAEGSGVGSVNNDFVPVIGLFLLQVHLAASYRLFLCRAPQ